MDDDDRTRWNRRYLAGSHGTDEPSAPLIELLSGLSPGGRVLDVAGGRGRHAIWLQQRGWDVTLADISDVALRQAAERAAGLDVALSFLHWDFEQSGAPTGPWNLIVVHDYLHRPLLPALAGELAPGGYLAMVHPTLKNRLRFARPSPRFLLADGELPNLVPALRPVRFDEGFVADGRHLARLLAVRALI